MACREIIIVNYAISNLICSGKAQQIPNAVMGGTDVGTVLIDRDIKRLVESGLVSLEGSSDRILARTAWAGSGMI